MRSITVCAAMAVLLATAPTADALHRPSGTDGPIRHVIEIALDNTHWEDVARMPHLAAFLRRGAVFDDDHSVLTAYTGPDMISFLSGEYPDKSRIVHNRFFQGGRPVSGWAYWDSDLYVDRDRKTRRSSVHVPYFWDQK